MRIVALDIETNIIEGTPDAWRTGTRIILSGTLSDDTGLPRISEGTKVIEALIEALPTDGKQLIVMHNGIFDLCHILKALGAPAIRWLLSPNVGLWDSQTVDYLAQRCNARMPGLEASGARYGVTIAKDAWASDAFAAGIGSDVLYAQDPQRLIKYLKSDLVGTLALQKAQALYIKAHMPRLERVRITQGRVLKLMALCIHNGMPIDQLLLLEATRANADSLAQAQRALTAAIDALLSSDIARKQFNADSPKQLAALLYGGEIVYDARVQVGVYKTGAKVGQPRFKIEHYPVTFKQRYAGGSSTDASALQALMARTCVPERVSAILPLLVQSRELAKLNGTYYLPITLKTAQSEQGRLHGKFNMCIANTGRKTSSSPNLQNLPESVRKCVKAPPGYKIVAIDAKQLEVIAWGHMSKDARLCRMLDKGTDIHALIKAKADVATGEDIQRVNIKRVVFGRIYGGGAARLSQQSGIPEDVVAAIIKIFDALFPQGRDYFKTVHTALRKHQRTVLNSEGVPTFVSHFELPSGRQLHFEASVQAGRHGDVDYSFTEMKNRPIQGFATADIVPYIEQELIGLFSKQPELVLEGRIIPLAVVHDEIVLQVHDKSIERVKHFFGTLASQLPARLTAWYGLDPAFTLPLSLSCGVADTWSAAKDSATPL